MKGKKFMDINNFDEESYLEANPDVKGAIEKGLLKSATEHLIKYGLEEIKEGKRKFHPDLDFYNEDFYLETHPDVVNALKEGEYDSAFEHFCKYGYNEIISNIKNSFYADADKCINDITQSEKNNCDINYQKSIVASAFDDEFYRMQYPDIIQKEEDPLEHYILHGWKLGIDPNPLFSVSFYLDLHQDVRESGIEPFFHWLTVGQKEGYETSLSFYPAKKLTDSEKAAKHLIDISYYWENNPDVKKAKLNPIVHYMRTGWREGRNPNKHFNTIHYLLNNLDVLTTCQNPLDHFIKSGKEHLPYFTAVDTVKKFLGDKIFHAMQDITFPPAIANAEKLFVIVIPEHNEMSGGIFSMFSIANVVKRLKSQHGYEVVLMTRPNPTDTTYCRQKNFPNAEDVFRLEQIVRCEQVKDLYLHIPEYVAPTFIENLNVDTLNFLKNIETLHINFLNQNFELMPESHEFENLRELTTNLTQSVAHHSYFKQELTDKYNLPTLLLPAYTDLSAYNSSTFENKDNLIIYSLDDAPHKEEVLKKIQEELPEYELIEIRGITFDQYMDLATRCKFSISFGEGFDGYVAQPIYQGGIGMTVYNEEYFPSEDFLQYDNFFSDEDHMIESIVSTIKTLSSDPKAYEELNKKLVAEWDKLYSFDEYVAQIKKLINKEFELIPGEYHPQDNVKFFKTGLSSHMVMK